MSVVMVFVVLAVASFVAIGESTTLQASSAQHPVIVGTIEGAIDPVTRDYVTDVLRRAEREDAAAVVFEMDTPGGLMSSMDEIIKEFLVTRSFPVIVYVAPAGAKAASAGAFITMSSDVAAMAPSTNIGSATPIQGNGNNIGGDLKRKVLNDAVTRLKTIAKEHGRDEKFAEEAIRSAANIDAREAKKRGVVEFVEPSLGTLLEHVDGYRTKPKNLTVHTAGAPITRVGMSWSMRLLKNIIDPNVVFLLFSAGLIGLAFELTHPGVILPGVAGAICLVVALYGFQVLPTTTAGVVLLLLAAAFFAGEILVVSHGVLGAGGAVSLFVGGLLLFDRDSPFAINIWILLAVTLCFGGFFGFVVHRVVAARREPPRTGRELLIGSAATVRRSLSPDGTVFAQGEIWKARTEDGAHVAAGEQVRVVAVDGLELRVSSVMLDVVG